MFSKTYAERQKYFKETTAFSCICDFCQDGEEDENDIAIYEAFKVKFIYSEKATKFCEISTNYLTGRVDRTNICGDFAKLCGLLRIYELYIFNHNYSAF